MAEPVNSERRQDGKLVGRLLFGALGLLLLGVVLTYATLFFGAVHGEEFAPDSFERRRFAYLELPLIRVQITPKSHNDETGDLEKFLVTKKIISTNAKPDTRWDLVYAITGGSGGLHGDARILCRYLDALDDDGDIVWLVWTEGNTELAKVLWPVIAKLAEQELYSFVPEVFALARTAAHPDELKGNIDRELADKYSLAAETFQALERDEAAVELFSEALLHDPNSVAAFEGRAESRRRLGQTEEADADAAQAKEIKGER
jgi:tetratricopeptide (TPR) repeat protein